MRLVFMGTPGFARAILADLATSNHEIVAVVTGPDRPAGRNRRLKPTEVRVEAEKNRLPIIFAESLKSDSLHQTLADLGADLFVVAAFRILPPRLLELPARGAINIHASLLPKYRGAAPINWALINGEQVTGLTSIFLNQKVDTGDIILQEKVDIVATETYDSLYERLSRLAGPFTLKTLELIESGACRPTLQNDAEATPAPKIHPDDAAIDFARPAEKVRDFIRGMSTRPGAFTFFRGQKLKVHLAAVAEASEADQYQPGFIIPARKRLLVMCHNSALELLRVVPAGKKEMDGVAFINGFRPQAGESFGKPKQGVQ